MSGCAGCCGALEGAFDAKLPRGDAVALAGELPTAAVVTLDQVICCYPEMGPLLATCTARAGRFFGIGYPRDAWWVRRANGARNLLRRLRGAASRVRVLPNRLIDAAIREAGFTLQGRSRGFVWVVALSARRDTP